MTFYKKNDIIIITKKEREVLIMRNLIYVLENGATVNTLEEAKASGKHFTMKCTPVKRPEIKLTEKQRAARVKI